MKLSTSLVAIKKISCTKPRSIFPEDELENAAKLILESEGVINPIVICRTDMQSFEVVDGYFEYHAAARAREIDPRKGEMIGVFIIEDENEEVLKKQIQLFRQPKATIPNNELSNSTINESRFINMESRQTNFEFRQNNLESRVENRLDELQENLKREIKNINNRLNELEQRIPKPIAPLEALNHWDINKLTSNLSRINIPSKIIENIVNEREKNGKFTSFIDVKNRTKDLGDKRILKIIDSFSDSAI